MSVCHPARNRWADGSHRPPNCAVHLGALSLRVVADVCQHRRRSFQAARGLHRGVNRPNARAILRRRAFTRVICQRSRNRSLTASNRVGRFGRRGIRCTKFSPACWKRTSQCGNQQALDVAENQAHWVKFRVDHISPDQMQRSLNTEQGGMQRRRWPIYIP